MATRHQRRQILAWSIFTALSAAALAPAFAQNAPANSTNNNNATPGSNQGNAGTTQGTKTLGQIQVTAEKHVEYLQDVPVTMATFDKQQLHEAGVFDIRDLQMIVPDLSVSNADNDGNITARIRGIGTVGDNAGLQSDVGIVIDGVPRARDGVSFGDLGELDQIEVLEGPQGTLFGKNTTAGVIDITTQRPTFTQQGYADITAGNYNAKGLDASYSNKISDKVAFRLYAVDRKHDGYDDVVVNGGPRTATTDDDQDFYSLRGQLLIKPTNNLEITVIGDYTQHNENCCAAVTTYRDAGIADLTDIFAGGAGLGVIPVANPAQRLEYANDSTAEKIIDQGLSTQVDWITPWFNNATLTSITSVRKYTLQAASDLDFSGANLALHDYGPDNGERFNTFSQELRLSGSTDHFDWLGGLYFDNERLQRSEAITEESPNYEGFLSTQLVEGIAAALPPGLFNTANPQNLFSQVTGAPYGASYSGIAQQDQWNMNTTSQAAFGNVTFHATDALSLTAGVRYTHEQVDYNAFFHNPNGGIGCGAALTTNGVANALIARGLPASLVPLIAPTVIGNMCLPWENPLFNGLSPSESFTENNWSGTLKAAYRWNDNVLTYLTGARGYKAGGYNLARAQSSNGLTSGGSGVIPIANTSFPAEFVDSFELGAKTTWADGNLLVDSALFHSKYTNFQLNTFSGISWVVDSIPELTTQGLDTNMLWQTPISGLSLQGAATYTKARYGNQALSDPTLAGLPGSVGSYAPKWASSAGFTYQWNLNSNLFSRFHLGAKYTSDYNASGLPPSPYFIQKAYTLVDARLTIGGDNKKWSVELWGQNLTNRTYVQAYFNPALQSPSVDAFLGDPRTFGVTLHLAL